MAQKQKKVKYILDHNGYTTAEKNAMTVLGTDTDSNYVEFKDGNDVDFMASKDTTHPIPIEQLADVSSILVYNAATSLTSVTYVSGSTRTITLESYAVDSNSKTYYVTPQTDYIAFSGNTGFSYDEDTGVLTVANTVAAGTYNQQIKYTKANSSVVTGLFNVRLTT